MFNLETHPRELILALQTDHSIGVNQKGEWWKQDWKGRLIRKIEPIDRSFNRLLLTKICAIFKNLEKEKVYFTQDDQLDRTQDKPFQDYLKLSTILLKKFENHTHLNPEVNELRYYKVALQYRLKIHLSEQVMTDSLKQDFQEWKKLHPMKGNREMNQHERVSLDQVSYYPLFLECLNLDCVLRHKFFNWIAEGADTESFILFPFTVDRLIWNHVSKVFAHHGSHHLKVEMKNVAHRKFRDLTMLFEGRRESIINEEKVICFRHDYALTIKEIFYVFRKRAEAFGNIEFSPSNGFINWNPIKLGSYNPLTEDYHLIDLERKSWIDQLEPMAVYSSEEAKSLFKDLEGKELPFDGKHWMAGVIGTNAHEEISAKDSHAYLGLLIPQENQTYYYYPFGKFAQEFPPELPETLNSFFKRLSAIFKSIRVLLDYVKGGIAYPDENIRNNRFSHAIYFSFSPEEGGQILEKIREDLLKARRGEFYFQYLKKSCIHWSFEVLRSKLPKPHVYEISGIEFLQVKTEGVLGALYRFLNRFSKVNQQRFLNMLMKGFNPNTIELKNSKGVTKRYSLPLKAPWEGKCLHPGMIIEYQNKRERL